MKHIFTLIYIVFTTVAFAQENGSITGKLTDKDYNNEPLPFANVIVKGTSTGTTSDFDGLYTLNNLTPGSYTIQFSFVGYETTEKIVEVIAGTTTTLDAAMGASAAALDEVVVKTSTRRDTEVALLLEQKRATTIKESIGTEQLAKLGVSDAATATTKISGVSKTDGSGDVFVRGLGDRYLYTTLNGLPIPSDDVERKNIDLGLFPARLIQSIDVSKTTSPSLSADQASGNIDIKSRVLNKSSLISASASSSINTEVASNDGFGNFKVSPNNTDVTAGFYNRDFNTQEAITEQSWNPETLSTPINRSFSFNAGKKIGEKLRLLISAGQASNFEYRSGVFRQFRGNFIDDTIPDATTWKQTIATSALADVNFRANDNNKLSFTSLLINKIEDEVFEGGRAGTTVIFEETNPADGFTQFIRDQNLKKTLLWVNQLAGEHDLSDKNTLNWAAAYNFLSADEPNRIRNEVNIKDDLVQLGTQGGFQQRKSIQKIEDIEYNGLINNETAFIDSEEEKFKINVGANIRKKDRNFGSQFFGVEEAFTNAINPESIDQISDIFTQQNFDNGLLQLNVLTPDFYQGELQSTAGYLDVLGVTGKFTVQAGLRYQRDLINVNWDVGNWPGRTGEESKDYRRLYPSVNIKYAVNEKLALRLANSTTTTLPEFKEIAPFEYVSPTGQITRGNVNIESSINRNFDLKAEYFLSNDQLFSVTGFYKKIEDPINKVQDRGSAGIFSYFNAGEEAEVYGIEIEGRINLLETEEEDPLLQLNTNISRMWHTQDLKEVRDDNGNVIRTFRYKGITETGLQGASNWIVNSSLNYSTNTDNEFDATLSGNYASDRIYALGSPNDQTVGDIDYNDAIVENGFIMLDLILGKRLNENCKIGLSAKNILNPEIKRTQLVRPSTTGIEKNETVLAYQRGMQIGLNINYTF